jgi:shikimate kinase
MMKQSENIYLIGLMGAGKTTIGRQLARALQLPFYDSDKAIEESTGVDIPTIFEFEGEAGFRAREQKMIMQLTELQGIILATGGGAVLRAENRQRLQANGFVVYLYCSVDKIVERTKRDPNRPLLQKDGDDPRAREEQLLARVEQLFAEREGLYKECADFEVNTGDLQSKAVVKAILKAYESVDH